MDIFFLQVCCYWIVTVHSSFPSNTPWTCFHPPVWNNNPQHWSSSCRHPGFQSIIKKQKSIFIIITFSSSRLSKQPHMWHFAGSQGACWSASRFSPPAPSSCRSRSERPSRRWTGCAPAAWGRTWRIHRPWVTTHITAILKSWYSSVVNKPVKQVSATVRWSKGSRNSLVVLLSSTLSSVRSVPSAVLENHFRSFSAGNNTEWNKSTLSIYESVREAAFKTDVVVISEFCAVVFSVTVTRTAAVFLFWRVRAVPARAGLTGGTTKIVYWTRWVSPTQEYSPLNRKLTTTTPPVPLRSNHMDSNEGSIYITQSIYYIARYM